MDRVRILEAIKNPAVVVALALLVVEAMLLAGLGVVDKGSPQQSLLIGGMVGCAIIAFISLPLLIYLNRKVGPVAAVSRPSQVYDVFLSTPMDALANDEERKAHRDTAMRVTQTLKSLGHTVFYAGADERTIDARHFDLPAEALKQNLDAIRFCKVFVLILPERRASSTLIEIGMALSAMRPCLFLIKKGVQLPYLIQGAAEAREPNRVPPVRVIEYDDNDHLLARMTNSGAALIRNVTGPDPQAADGG